MNYQRIYTELIESCRSRETIEGYFETHHILPKCLGGSNSDSNLVKLTAREHYIAHWLLTKIHSCNYKLFFAFSLMDGSLSPKGNRKLTSIQYERCKIARSIAMKLKCREDGFIHHMKNDNLRKYFSDRLKGDNNPTRKFPEKNRTAYPVTVVFKDGTEIWFEYGKKAAKELNIPYSTWKYASKDNRGIPSQGIIKIIKHHKTPEQEESNKRNGDSQRKITSCEG